MYRVMLVSAFILVLGFGSGVSADGSPAMPGEFLARMPVKEITVFKDGHAFIRHEGVMAIDGYGRVVLDHLPRPVIGTFWTYSAEEGVTIQSVTASKKVVAIERTALTIMELIEANVGRKVRIKEQNQSQFYDAWIERIPVRTSEEVERTSADGQHSPLPVCGEVVMLKTAEGLKVVPIAQVERITFLETPEEKVKQSEQRNVMTIKVDAKNGTRPGTARMGMLYLQRGIRWIPSYHVDIDGAGNAAVKMQATLVNELSDLEDVTAHLVIGVPTFAFKETVDPISLEQTIAQLSNHFQQNARNAHGFDNAIRSQMIMFNTASYVPPMNTPEGAGGAIDLGPEVTAGVKNEDLYVFTVEHLTLKKGERMVLPVVEFALGYRNVYVVEMPFSPPPEASRNFNSEQQSQLARLMRAPKAMHVIRFKNESTYPLTTAPALIFRQGRLVAQGMTRYTPMGATGNLELTTAVDILAKKTDTETERVPNAVRWSGNDFAKCSLQGKITLASHKDEAVEVEVRRFVLGTVTGASGEGEVNQVSWHEGGWGSNDAEQPVWWSWYGWPYWWHHMNPVGRIDWRLTLAPGETVELEYGWHYFWRF